MAATKQAPQGASPASSGGSGTSINFKNNCIICLEPEVPAKMLEIIQKNPKNLRTFQPIVHYLTGTDPTWGKSQEECAAKDLPLMTNLPPLCARCYDTAADIYQFHAQLLELQLLIQSKTENLRRLVASTRKGGDKSTKFEFLSRLRRSGMPDAQVYEMNKFVDNFHGRIAVQGGKKVKFPSHPPPNFLPLPKPTVTPVVLLQIPLQQLQQQTPTPPPPTTTAAPIIPTPTTTSISRVPPPIIPTTSISRVPPPIIPTTSISRVPPPTIPTTSISRVPPPTPIISSSTPLLAVTSCSNVSLGSDKPKNAISDFVRRPAIISIKSTKSSVSAAGKNDSAVLPPPQPSSRTPITPRSETAKKPMTKSFTSASTTKSDIVMLPGSSATIKYENEMEDEDEEQEENAQHFINLEPEVVLKEEPRDEMIFPDEDDEPPPPNNDDEDTSDEDWVMNEDDDDSEKTATGNEDDDNSDYEDRNETRHRSHHPPKKNISNRRQPQLKKSKSPSNHVNSPQSSSGPLRVLPKILTPQQQPMIIPDQMDSSLGVHVTPALGASMVTTSVSEMSSLKTAPSAVGLPVGSSRRKQVLLTKDQLQRQPLNPPPPQVAITSTGKVKISKKCVNGSYYKRKVKDKLECDVCNVRFPPDQLPSHTRTHLGGEDGHFCPSCHRVFISRSKLLQHWQVRLCGRDMRYKNANFDDSIICTTCPSTPGQLPIKYSLLDFQKHVFSTHETSTDLARVHECVFCHSKFRTDHGLDFHLNLHSHPERRYQPGHWDICPPAAKTRLKYDTIFKMRSIKIRCDVCQISNLWYRLEGHIVSVHGIESDNLIRCLLCPFLSTKLETYLNHLTDVHEDLDCDDITCYLCATNFVKIAQLRLHLFQRHGLAGAMIICDFCGTHFMDKNDLDSHMRLSHKANPQEQEQSPQQKLVCEYCPPSKQIGFKSMKLLNRHKCHCVEKFKCQRCYTGFATAGMLHRHEQSAHHEKPIVCALCQKTFSLQKAYYRHMKKAHYGGSRGSTTKSGQRGKTRHHQQETHANAVKRRGPVCPVCSMTFLNSSSLWKHQRDNHPEEPIVPATTSVTRDMDPPRSRSQKPPVVDLDY